MVAVSIAAAIGPLRPVEVDTPLKMASSFALDALGRVYFCIMASLGILATLWPNAGPLQTTTQGGTTPSLYLLGLGIGDVTGPIVETNMMGYADIGQSGTGIHMRQRARAFVIADPSNSTQRILFINADISMSDHGLRAKIIKELGGLYPGLYSDQNVALVATHSHAGVGGFASNLLPQITSLGFVPATFNAIVAGTLVAVQKAHANLELGTLSVGNTTVLDANINRSPSAYDANPAAEKARYAFNVDKEMSLLKFLSNNGTQRGFLSFFPVHGTSLYKNNTFISSDNKGMAAWMYENFVEPTVAPGNTSFVAGFVQANAGDVTPNTLGAYCEAPGKPYHGLECDYYKSTCGNTTQECHGRGPGFRISDFESNRIIASHQFQGAKKLMAQPLTSISGPIKGVHTFVDMSNYNFALANGATVHTCPSAMGYAFAGGTTDGPGVLDFTQGTTSGNPFWDIVKLAASPPPSAEQIACHAPKPILINSGAATWPYDWQPKTVNVQMLRIGQLVMIIFPGELTTMAGRRLREAIRTSLISQGVIGENAYVILAGPANTYAHYVTTREEYGVQRYEGGSTLYGRFTLEAFIDNYSKLVPNLVPTTGSPPPGTPQPDQSSRYLSLQPRVFFDAVPPTKFFGQPTIAPAASYSRGQTVRVGFEGANPRNNLRLEQTFFTVERQSGRAWIVVRTDSHPSTRLSWLRTNGPLGYSNVSVTWTIEPDTPAGAYRIRYYGDSKPLIGRISAFVGTSASFVVTD